MAKVAWEARWMLMSFIKRQNTGKSIGLMKQPLSMKVRDISSFSCLLDIQVHMQCKLDIQTWCNLWHLSQNALLWAFSVCFSEKKTVLWGFSEMLARMSVWAVAADWGIITGQPRHLWNSGVVSAACSGAQTMSSLAGRPFPGDPSLSSGSWPAASAPAALQAVLTGRTESRAAAAHPQAETSAPSEGALQFCSLSLYWTSLNTALLIKFTVSEVKPQSCLTLCHPMSYTVHGILQARIPEGVAFPFSRDLPNPRIEPRSPTLQADSLPAEPPGEPKV